jgi:hypothetical protein
MAILAVLQGAASIFLIYIICASIYYWINRDDKETEPPGWWPEWLKNLVHNYPPNYTFTSNTLIQGVVSNTFSANIFSASDCARKDVDGCDDQEGCIGFTYQQSGSSNTCIQYTAVSNLFQDFKITGNTLYLVEGNEPAKDYAVYSSNGVSSTTTASLIPPYISTDYFDCASNCTSNSLCLGFTFNPTSKQCVQRTTMTKDSLVVDTALNAYLLQTPSFTGATF